MSKTLPGDVIKPRAAELILVLDDTERTRVANVGRSWYRLSSDNTAVTDGQHTPHEAAVAPALAEPDDAEVLASSRGAVVDYGHSGVRIADAEQQSLTTSPVWVIKHGANWHYVEDRENLEDVFSGLKKFDTVEEALRRGPEYTPL